MLERLGSSDRALLAQSHDAVQRLVETPDALQIHIEQYYVPCILITDNRPDAPFSSGADIYDAFLPDTDHLSRFGFFGLSAILMIRWIKTASR